jgi:hypothetical protein
MSLPTEKKKPSTNLWDYTILLYGQKLIGKSSLANEIPNNIFLNAGGGLEAIECFQIPLINWNDYKLAVAELIDPNAKHSFKVVTLDTVDRIHKLCVTEMMKKLEITHPADLDFGKGWDLIKDEFMRPTMALVLSGLGVVMISHVKDKEITTRTAKFNKSITTLQDHIWQMIESVSGIILFYSLETDAQGVEKRVLKVKASENYISGDRTGKLAAYGNIDIGPVGTNWGRIQKIFDGTLVKEK